MTVNPSSKAKGCQSVYFFFNSSETAEAIELKNLGKISI